jgi:hypothetical protein
MKPRSVGTNSSFEKRSLCKLPRREGGFSGNSGTESEWFSKMGFPRIGLSSNSVSENSKRKPSFPRITRRGTSSSVYRQAVSGCLITHPLFEIPPVTREHRPLRVAGGALRCRAQSDSCRQDSQVVDPRTCAPASSRHRGSPLRT